MTLYARQRQDLLDQNLQVPTGQGVHIMLDEWTACSQPDELDDEEFNLQLFNCFGNKITTAMSIDFDYKELFSVFETDKNDGVLFTEEDL
jgi:hypothetical protein